MVCGNRVASPSARASASGGSRLRAVHAHSAGTAAARASQPSTRTASDDHETNERPGDDHGGPPAAHARATAGPTPKRARIRARRARRPLITLAARQLLRWQRRARDASAIDARDAAQHLAGEVAGVGGIVDGLGAQEAVGDVAALVAPQGSGAPGRRSCAARGRRAPRRTRCARRARRSRRCRRGRWRRRSRARAGRARVEEQRRRPGARRAGAHQVVGEAQVAPTARACCRRCRSAARRRAARARRRRHGRVTHARGGAAAAVPANAARPSCGRALARRRRLARRSCAARGGGEHDHQRATASRVSSHLAATAFSGKRQRHVRGVIVGPCR